MTFQFLHAADVHLDSPLRGLERYPGAPVERIRNATRQALKNLVDLALIERVAFVLIAGDVYDGDWDNYHTGLHFVAEMARLNDAKIPVYLISGNHDAQSKMTRALRLPPNVRSLRTDRPETIAVDQWNVAIHGQGFGTAAVTEDLSARYPQALPGCFNVGLLHTSADGREGHAAYAPCQLEGLRSKGYDYWALGHVHHREVLHRDPWIVFPGNVQGRHVRETGPKGCTLVTVEPGPKVTAEPRWLDVLRWERLTVAVDGIVTGDDVLQRCDQELRNLCDRREGRALAVRVELRGSCAAHVEWAARPTHWTQQLRSLGAEVGQGELWLEKIELKTTSPRERDRLLGRDGPLAELRELIGELQADEGRLGTLRDELTDLKKKLPSELREGLAMEFDAPVRLRTWLGEVEHLLTQRLLTSGE